MPLSVKHTFESPKSDGADPTLLQPSHWNAEHDFTVPSNSLVGNSTGAEAQAAPVSVGAGLAMSAGELTNPSATAEVLVAATIAGVPNGRVPTGTATVTWDFATPLQAKANIPGNAVTLALMEHGTQGAVFYYGAAGAPARLSAGSIGTFLKAGGAGADPVWGYSGAPHAVLQDQKAGGTDGGTFTSGSFIDRVLNTEVYDLYNFVTLAGNAFTLPAGTWIVEWSAPAYRVDSHQSRLWNETDSAVVGQGTSEAASDGVAITTRSEGIAKVVTVASKAFKIQHRCSSTWASLGLGAATTLGGEVYTTVNIWRVA